MKILEKFGHLLSYPTGVIFAVISFMRAERTFHPVGLTMTSVVTPLNDDGKMFSNRCLIRFSGALWKTNHRTLPDALGISLRFSHAMNFTPFPELRDQDLLFASFQHIWLAPLSPLITSYERFQKNIFYSITGFEVNQKKLFFQLRFNNFHEDTSIRDENLRSNARQNLSIVLSMSQDKKEWEDVLTLSHLKEVALDQRQLCFNPFRCGLGVRPVGFINHLRYAVYPMSQYGRMLRQKTLLTLKRSKVTV